MDNKKVNNYQNLNCRTFIIRHNTPARHRPVNRRRQSKSTVGNSLNHAWDDKRIMHAGIRHEGFSYIISYILRHLDFFVVR